LSGVSSADAVNETLGDSEVKWTIAISIARVDRKIEVEG
jgi:hypothetical protein